MRLGPAIAVLMLIAALVLPGCGDGETSAAGAGQSVPGTGARATANGSQTTASASKAPVGPGARRQTAHCRHALGDLLDATESLDNLVAVGVDYESHLSAVNHIRAVYAEVEADELPLPCLAAVAAPAERALNAYIEAANVWGECLADASCEDESVEPELKRLWARARAQIASAQRGLRRGE
jgi:hypothetical protein